MAAIRVYKVGDKIIVANSGLIKGRKRFCTVCQEFVEFEFYHLKKRYGNWHFSSYCKVCTVDVMQAYYRRKGRKPQRYRARKEDENGIIKWRCCRCKRYKYSPDFWKLSCSPDGLYYYCIACSKRNKKKKSLKRKIACESERQKIRRLFYRISNISQ